jgi:hypothetical protein
MRTGMDLAAIGDLADVELVLQEMRERTDPIIGGGDDSPARQSPGFRSKTLGVERRRQRADRAQSRVVLENLADELRLLRLA